VVAKLYSKSGEVFARRGLKGQWQPVEVDATFAADDGIRVSKLGRAGILFENGYFMRLSNNATVSFNSFTANDPKPLRVDSGLAHFYSRGEERGSTIATPVVSAAIRGTEFVIDVADSTDKVAITVIDGSVEAFNQYGKTRLGKGQSAVTLKGYAPQKQLVVSPEDAVQWTISIPSGMPLRDLFHGEGLERLHQATDAQGARAARDFFNGRAATDYLGRAVLLHQEGASQRALDELSAYRGNDQCEILVYRSSLLLEMGKLAEAKATLARIDSLGCSHTARANQLSLLSLIQIASNESVLAAKTAQSALAQNSSIPLPHYSLAMLAQSEFELEAAKEHLLRMLELDPGSALGLTRLAEVALALNDTELAASLLVHLKKNNLDGGISESVRGFLHLLHREYQPADKAFHRAIAHNSELALPHLGLGLVAFAQGNADGGLHQIKTAVALDPQTALYRSYLGKALFETEREAQSLPEYRMAMELDPRDPTPYMYRSFTHLSKNDPVLALKDLQQAIDLNDNRGVYRSRFLLDKDVGTRSAGLARVYSDLGFRRVSRLEAIKSINADYKNFSAHRLLAESSPALFDADAALSERKIADLLAPLSFNLFNSTGEAATLNDYNALFDKSEQRTLGAYSYDERSDQNLGVMTHTGKSEKVGYLASIAGVVGDGSKDNSYARDYRGQIGLQYQPTYTTRFLYDSGYSYRQFADPGRETELLDQYKFSSNVGLNHELSPHLIALAQAGYSKQTLELTGINANRPLNSTIAAFNDEFSFTSATISRDATELEQDTGRGELQLAYDGTWVDSVIGTLSIGSSYRQSEQSPIIDDEFTIYTDIGREFQTRSDDAATSHDVYWYNFLTPHRSLTLTAGGAASYVRSPGRTVTPYVSQSISTKRVNPKVGAVYTPGGNLTFRTAWFESLRKAAEDAQSTLEPVLVGGIVQRFNDLPGSYSRNVASAADWHLGNFFYCGVEGLSRHVVDKEVQAIDDLAIDYDALTTSQGVRTTGINNFHQEQRFLRGYLYGVLSERLVTSADYFHSDARQLDPSIDSSIESHNSEFAFRYFAQSGWFSLLRESWVQQNRHNDARFANGTEDFWLTDLGFGYRIPKRHGTISLEVLNLFDRNFSYSQDQQFEQAIRPARSLRVAATYNF
jgi:Tfp pilus assembly protein PilF